MSDFCGAERDAHAELLRLTRHRVRNHAVDADGREQQAEAGEGREQNQVEPRQRERRFVDELIQRTHFGHGLIFVQRADLSARDLLELVRRQARLEQQVEPIAIQRGTAR